MTSITVPASLLDTLKVFLGIDPSDTSQDAELDAALQQAIVAVETWLDRIVIKRSVEEYFPYHFGTVQLHEYPVDTSVDVVVTKDGVADANYIPWLQRGKMSYLSRIGSHYDTPMDWRKFSQVVITYTAGYDPLPLDLANAIVWTAAAIKDSFGTGVIPGGSSGDVKSMSIYDVGSISYDVGVSSGGGKYVGSSSLGVIPETAAETLSRYKRMSA